MNLHLHVNLVITTQLMGIQTGSLEFGCPCNQFSVKPNYLQLWLPLIGLGYPNSSAKLSRLHLVRYYSIQIRRNSRYCSMWGHLLVIWSVDVVGSTAVPWKFLIIQVEWWNFHSLKWVVGFLIYLFHLLFSECASASIFSRWLKLSGG